MSLATSIIELKAELSKRKEEAKNNSSKKVNLKGGYKWKLLAEKLDCKTKVKQLKAKREKTSDDEERKAIDQEIEKELRLSREALERKATIYEAKMSKALDGIFQDSDDEPDNEDEQCLVNFDEKAYETIKRKNEERKKAEERLKSYKDDNNDVDDNDEDDWVEFIDSFGRSRKCLRKDLQYFKESDKNFHQKSDSSSETNSSKRFKPYNSDDSDNDDKLLSDTKKIEREDEPVGPIHYKNVRFNEVRNHGVGFYEFSGDTEERKKQMEELNQLRAQTIKQTELKSKLKEKKSNALEQRLKRIAARRGIK